jgi:hypothetical protein
MKVIPGHYYRHREGGVYLVVCEARMEKNLWPVVVYKVSGSEEYLVRPTDEFLERFKLEEVGSDHSL